MLEHSSDIANKGVISLTKKKKITYWLQKFDGSGIVYTKKAISGIVVKLNREIHQTVQHYIGITIWNCPSRTQLLILLGWSQESLIFGPSSDMAKLRVLGIGIMGYVV